MLQTRNYVLPLDPDNNPGWVMLAQNEDGRDLVFTLSGNGTVNIPEGSTAVISGKKPDGTVYTATCAYADMKVTVPETLQMTAVPGEWQATIRILYNGETIASARIRFSVDADPTGGDLPSDSQLDGAVAEAKYYAETARSAAYGSPLTAATAADMIDTTRVYVYTGNETGMENGHWYYWEDGAWKDGGIYNAAAVQTDTSLSIPGMAADAKATGEAIAAEAAAREQADTALQTAIDTKADTSALTAETAAREQADADLKADLTIVKDGVYDSVTTGTINLLPYQTWHNGGYVDSDGSITSASRWYYSDFFPVDKIGKNVTTITKSTFAIKWAQYDASKNFISGSFRSYGSVITAPYVLSDDCVYLRMSVGAWSGSYTLTDYLNTIELVAESDHSITVIENEIETINKNIGENQLITFTDGYCIKTTHVSSTANTEPIGLNTLTCFAVPCTKGDIFTISGTPNNNSGTRPYMWVNSNNIVIYRDETTDVFDRVEVVAPDDGTLVVNMVKAQPHEAYKGLSNLKSHVIENLNDIKDLIYSPLETMPEYITNDLAYKPLGQLQHPYICLTCDDGSAELETYTIPMLLEKNVPCTFGLWASSSKVGAAIPFGPSRVLTTESGRAAVLNAISHGCSVAQHGGIEWTEYDEADLNEFFDREQAAFNALGITVSGAICPSHCINNTVRAVAGGRFGSVRSGYKGYKSKTDMQNNIPGDVFDPYEYRCAGARTNVYGYSSFNTNAVSLEYMKSAVDYAIANNLVLIVYWHDWDLTSSQKADLEALIDYAKTQNITFCTLGEIPTLI